MVGTAIAVKPSTGEKTGSLPDVEQVFFAFKPYRVFPGSAVCFPGNMGW